MITHSIRRFRVLVSPWCDCPSPDWDVIFATEDAWLLFHTTSSPNVARILEHGFEDRTCRIGFAQRSSDHGVFFGGVPAIPASVDYFDERLMSAGDAAWIVVEAPRVAWPDQAASHWQDPTWPLYQVCYRADQVNTWPRRQLPLEEVLIFRPTLMANSLEYISEAVREGWLAQGLLKLTRTIAPTLANPLDGETRETPETSET